VARTWNLAVLPPAADPSEPNRHRHGRSEADDADAATDLPAIRLVKGAGSQPATACGSLLITPVRCDLLERSGEAASRSLGIRWRSQIEPRLAAGQPPFSAFAWDSAARGEDGREYAVLAQAAAGQADPFSIRWQMPQSGRKQDDEPLVEILDPPPAGTRLTLTGRLNWVRQRTITGEAALAADGAVAGLLLDDERLAVTRRDRGNRIQVEFTLPGGCELSSCVLIDDDGTSYPAESTSGSPRQRKASFAMPAGNAVFRLTVTRPDPPLLLPIRLAVIVPKLP
jgi:hypothetical protein